MTTPAPPVTDPDDFERRLLELRKREEGTHPRGRRDRRGWPAAMTEVPPDTTVIGPDGAVQRCLRGARRAGRLQPCSTTGSHGSGSARAAQELLADAARRRRGLPQRQRDHLRHPRRRTVRGDRGIPRLHGLHSAVVLNAHLDDPTVGVAGRISCYLRREDKIYLTYWTTGRGDEVMSPSFGLLDLTPTGGGRSGRTRPRVAAVPDPLLHAHRRARCADRGQKRRSTGAPVDAPGGHRAPGDHSE